MNLCTAQAASLGGDNKTSGGGFAAPAHPLTVGCVGFGPAWEDQPTLRELYDQACASIVRAEREIEELRAEVALLREERSILSKRLDARVDLAGTAAEDKAGVTEGSLDVSSDSDLSPRTTLPQHIVREVIRGDDGEAIYWPTCDHGAYPAHLLRDIADHLDALNTEVSK